MGLLQKLIVSLVPPATASRMRRQTNQWQLRCKGCGAAQPLWEAGGIRYRKSSTKSGCSGTFVRCPHCREIRYAVTEFIGAGGGPRRDRSGGSQ